MMVPNSIRLMSSVKEKLQSYLIFLATLFINLESSHMKARKKIFLRKKSTSRLIMNYSPEV